MAAEFIDILKEPELDIGHSKKVLFTSDHFTPGCTAIIRAPKGPCTSTPPISSFIVSKASARFTFPTPARALNPGMLVTIPAGQLYQLDNTGSEYMILLGARAEPAGNPRFSATDREVGHGDFAKKNLDKIKAPEDKKVRARAES
jgi:Mannose-6-phosphate isomerase